MVLIAVMTMQTVETLMVATLVPVLKVIMVMATLAWTSMNVKMDLMTVQII